MELHTVVKGITLALIAILCSACAGMEIGGRAGIYRVDEQQSSSRTYRQDTKPIKCMFVNCDGPKRYRDNEDMGS
jgi:hypothetical protein